MIVKIAKRGTSFKGAGMYYLHDKREEGESVRTSSDRVAWTDTRNLATKDPEFALKLMAATAMDKDRLKEQAGVRNTGRKSKGDVYAYSIAWHPDEQGKFDRAQMLEAADQSLKALGAQDHQALIVAHQDEDHPHLHIIVNMVNAENGKNLSTSNDRKKTHKWSNDYRKARGEEHIFCPNKAKKFEAIEDKKRGHKVAYQNDGKDMPRNLYDAFKDAKRTARPNDLKESQALEAAKDLKLSQAGRQMHSRHGHQWDALSDNYALRKKNIHRQHREEKDDAIDAVTAQMKPAFRQLYKDQWAERNQFERREQSIAGQLKNMAAANRYANEVRGDGNAHIVKKAYNFFGNAGRRAAWLNAKQNSEQRALRGEQGARIKDAVGRVAEHRDRRLTSARQDFGIEREALIHSQGREKADLRQSWKARNAERQATVEILRRSSRIEEMDERAEQSPDRVLKGRVQKQSTSGDADFLNSLSAKPKRTRKPRPRKKDADRDVGIPEAEQFGKNAQTEEEFKAAQDFKKAGADYRDKLRQKGAEERSKRDR